MVLKAQSLLSPKAEKVCVLGGGERGSDIEGRKRERGRQGGGRETDGGVCVCGGGGYEETDREGKRESGRGGGGGGMRRLTEKGRENQADRFVRTKLEKFILHGL